MPAQDENDYKGLDPREVVDVRFFLRPEELEEAASVRKVASNQKSSKALMRAICGLGALYIAFVPQLKGASWAIWWHREPVRAFYWSALFVLDVWIVLGQFGVQKLNALANRLDKERRICVSHRRVDITLATLSSRRAGRIFHFSGRHRRCSCCRRRVLPSGRCRNQQSPLDAGINGSLC